MRVLSGAGLFAAPGAGEPHHFTGITSDLAALVLFAPAEYSRAADGR
jgi:hypothetical protein